MEGYARVTRRRMNNHLRMMADLPASATNLVTLYKGYRRNSARLLCKHSYDQARVEQFLRQLRQNRLRRLQRQRRRRDAETHRLIDRHLVEQAENHGRGKRVPRAG